MNEINEMNENRSALTDEQMTAVSGGGIPWYTNSQYSALSVSLANVISKIIAATKPSYNYSDVGANFMSLILDWAEYYLGYNGKKESDPKAKAIEAVLRAKGVDMIEVRIAIDRAMMA